MSLRNILEPATLVRSPTLTKFKSGVSTKGSNPDNCMGPICFGLIFLGDALAAIAAMASICAGLVPQHPPTIFTNPKSTYS